MQIDEWMGRWVQVLCKADEMTKWRVRNGKCCAGIGQELVIKATPPSTAWDPGSDPGHMLGSVKKNVQV